MSGCLLWAAPAPSRGRGECGVPAQRHLRINNNALVPVTVTVHRKSVEELELAGDSSVKGQDSPKSSPKSSPNTQNQILTLISKDPSITTEQLGLVSGISKRAVLRQISKLKVQGRLRRIGSARGGHWEVSD